MKTKKLSGLIVLFCSVIILMSSLYLPASAAKSISKAAITVASSVSYTGKTLKPTVKVKLSGKTLSSKYYTVSYKNNKNIGTATVTVKGKNGYGGKVSKNFKIVPGKVKGLEADATENSITLSWNKVSGAKYYQVFLYTSKGWVRQATVTARSYTVKGLKAGTTYAFKVRAYTKVGSTNYIGVYSSTFKTPTLLPAPKTIKTSATKSSINISWSTVSGADYYQVWLYDDNNGWSLIKNTTAKKYTINDLKSGRNYQVKIRPFTKEGSVKTYGLYSESYKVTTLIPDVEELGADSVTSTSASVYWNSLYEADKYLVAVNDVAAGERIVKEFTDTADIDLKNLKEASLYKVTVKAYQASPKVYSAGVSFVFCTAPDKVQNVTVSETSADSALISWVAPAEFTGFEVSINELGSNSEVVDTVTLSTSETSFAAKNLKGATKYSVEVKTYIIRDGRKAYSEAVSAPEFRTLPGPVSSLVATAGNDRISLKWDIQSGADGYLVLDSEKNVIRELGGSQNIHTVMNLQEGKTYTFYVRSFCNEANGEKVFSADAKITATTLSNKATAVKFAKKISSMSKGSTFSTAIAFEPAGTTAEVFYSSSSENVARIDQTGKITAISEGKTKITVETADGALKDAFMLTVEKIKSTSISLPSSIKGYVGEYTKIEPQFVPAEVSDKTFTLSGADHTYQYTELVVFTKTGTCKFSDYFYFDDVTGRILAKKATVEPETKKAFAFTVTVTANDSGAKCTFKLSAEKRAIAITYDGDDNPWYYGNSARLTAEVDMSAGFTKNQLSWKSSNTNIATVSSNGTVNCVGVGDVTITATSPDGKHSRSYNIYVRETVKLDKSYFDSCVVGNTYQLNASVVPSTSNAKLLYLSSNPKVAEVSDSGTVTIKGEGYCDIHVSTPNSDTVVAVFTTKSFRLPSGTESELLSVIESNANGIKTAMPSITKTSYSNFTNVKIENESKYFSTADLIDTFESFAYPESKRLAAVNSVNYPSSEEYSKAASKYISSVPVMGQNFTIIPGLESSQIKSVEVIDSNSYTYDIKLTLNDEYMSAPPTSPTRTAHGKVFDVFDSSYMSIVTEILQSDASLGAKLEYAAFTQNYNNSSLTLTFNKATGKLMNMKYDMNIHIVIQQLKLDMAIVSAIDSDVVFDVNNVVNIKVNG